MKLSTSVIIVSTILATVKAYPQYVASSGVSFPCGDDIPNWVANIQIGNPKQTIPMLLDTSSGSTWVAGVQCHSEFCATRTCSLFDGRKSSTISDYYLEEEYSYEEGTVETDLYTDDLYIGNKKFEDFVFGKAFKVNGFNNSPAFAGILGLGDDIEDTLILRARKPKFRPETTVAMPSSIGGPTGNNERKKRNYGHEKTCEFNFGVDTSRIEGNIAWLDLPTCDYGPTPYWKARLTCAKIAGVVNLSFDKTVASFDTSVSNIQMPHKDIAQIHQALHAGYNQQSKRYEFQCCNANELTFSFEKYDVTLPVEAWTRKVDEDTCTDIFEVRKPSPFEDDNTWKLGTKFMINFLTVLDTERDKTGLALLAGGNNGLRITAK